MRSLLVALVGIVALVGPAVAQAQNQKRFSRARLPEAVNGRQSKSLNRNTKEVTQAQSSQLPKGQAAKASTSTGRNNPNDPQFQPKPDLVALYVIDRGNTAIIAVQNRGKVRSNATTARLVISSLGAAGTKVRNVSLGSLEPNGTKLLHVRGLLLSHVSMSVRVDAADKNQESDETNNLAFHVVEDQTNNGPDMAITKIQFFSKQKEVWVTVHNYGKKKVDRSTLHLESKFGLKLNERMRHTIKDLRPGTHQIYRFFPKQMQRGMQFEAIADINNHVPEQSEGNNRRTQTY
ncbi:MAG: CARDB domain-containing protein [Lacipirellulaceae bacterium]